MKNFFVILSCFAFLFSCQDNKSANKKIKTHNPTAEIPQVFTVLEAEDLFYQAWNLNKNGEYISARKVLVRSLDHEKNPITYNEIGISFLGERNIEQAIVYFKKAINLDSNYYPSHINLSRCYLITSEYETGKKVLYNMISKCDSEYWKAYGNMFLAMFYFTGDKDCEKAMEALKSAQTLKQDLALKEQYENFMKRLIETCG